MADVNVLGSQNRELYTNQLGNSQPGKLVNRDTSQAKKLVSELIAQLPSSNQIPSINLASQVSGHDYVEFSGEVSIPPQANAQGLYIALLRGLSQEINYDIYGDKDVYSKTKVDSLGKMKTPDGEVNAYIFSADVSKKGGFFPMDLTKIWLPFGLSHSKETGDLRFVAIDPSVQSPPQGFEKAPYFEVNFQIVQGPKGKTLKYDGEFSLTPEIMEKLPSIAVVIPNSTLQANIGEAVGLVLGHVISGLDSQLIVDSSREINPSRFESFVGLRPYTSK